MVLAQMAVGKLRAKREELEEALDGRFESHHAAVVAAILDHIDFLATRIWS